MKTIKIVLVTLIMMSMLGTALGASDRIESPSPPISIKLSIDDLKLNDIGDLTIVTDGITDVDNAVIDLELSDGVTLISGNKNWKANLKANKPEKNTVKIKLTKKGIVEIKANVKKVIDDNNVIGDMDIIYLDVGEAKSSAPNNVKETLAKTDDLPKNIKIIKDKKTNQAVQESSVQAEIPSFDNQKQSAENPGPLTVYGTFSYYTKAGDYRPYSNIKVRAPKILVEVLNGYNTHLAYGYTDANGYFSIPISNPGSIGVKFRWYAYVKYGVNDELMTIVPGGSGFGSTYYAYSNTMVLSDGYQFVGDWYLPQGNIIEGAYWIKNDLERAYWKTPTRPGRGVVEWGYYSNDGTYYSYGGNIHLKGVDRMSPDTVIHEYGHNVMWNLYGNWFPYNDCISPHYINKIGGTNCGWTEGWADFFPLYVNGNPTYTWASGSYLNLETPTWGTAYWDNGDKVEGRVAGALWDIYDGVNDGNDQITDGIGKIWNTIATQKNDGHSNDNTFGQYWNALRTKYTSDNLPKLALYQNTINYGSVTNSINVLSPNGGEVWLTGNNKELKWGSTGNTGANVKIELYKAGVLNKVIVSSTPNDGSYYWIVPTTQAAGKDYKIKITSTSFANILDFSNNYFTITPGIIKVTSPNSGVSWAKGTKQYITWSKTGNTGSYVKIELLKGGVLNRVITSSTSNSGSYLWTIPSTQAYGLDYKIRITSTSNVFITDTSDVNFKIY